MKYRLVSRLTLATATAAFGAAIAGCGARSSMPAVPSAPAASAAATSSQRTSSNAKAGVQYTMYWKPSQLTLKYNPHFSPQKTATLVYSTALQLEPSIGTTCQQGQVYITYDDTTQKGQYNYAHYTFQTGERGPISCSVVQYAVGYSYAATLYIKVK